MKFIICFTTLLMAASSFAKIADTPLAPIYRKGTIKFTITKDRLEKKGDTYDLVSEQVCSNSLPINVWDLRSETGKKNWNADVISCNTIYEGKPITANVVIHASIERVNLFDSEPAEVFSFMGGLTLDNGKPGVKRTDFSFSTKTRDLNQNSIINTVGPSSTTVCDKNGKCTISNPEIIAATVEFIGQ